MFLIAYVPPLWFKVMDHRVVKATGGDAARINFLPAQRKRLVAAYGMKDTAPAQA
jgi:alkane 1-monooxygenase